MKNKYLILFLSLVFATLNVYLFVEAPSPLPEKSRKPGKLIPVNEAFICVAKENDLVRGLYTKSIVGQGLLAGLKYREDWDEKQVEAGPLPALFLRSTSNYLEKHPVELGLFLGSDFPISSANRFTGLQEKYFNEMKRDKQPRFFFDESTQRYTAMFPDMAVAQTCIDCHNKHEQSPKKNWKPGDMMGATTWTYPQDSVSIEEIQQILAAYRQGVKSTYETYLKKTENFAHKPQKGVQWPSQGYFLPSSEVFMDSANKMASPYSLKMILAHLEN